MLHPLTWFHSLKYVYDTAEERLAGSFFTKDFSCKEWEAIVATLQQCADYAKEKAKG